MKLFVLLLLAVSFALTTAQFNDEIYDQSFSTLWMSMYIQTYVQPAVKAFNEEMPDSQCKRDLNFTNENLMNNELWSYQMFDAWAKPQTGILTGNVMHIGNYDECLAVSKVTNETRIRGKYCSAFVSSNDRAVLRYLTNVLHGLEMDEKNKSYGELVTNFDKKKASWGICVPNSCTAGDLRRIWIFIRDRYELDIDVQFNDHFCDFEGKRPLTALAIFTIAFLCIFGIIIVASAFYDVKIYQKRSGAEPNLIVAFSAYSNAKKILSTKITDNCLSCLNGIRVISMIWIMAGHRLILSYYIPHINSKTFNEWITEPDSMIFLAATFGVDTFLLISGLLLSFLFLQNNEKGGKFNLPLFYLHRLLRLTPSLAVVVLVFTSLIWYIGSGPFWPVAYDILQKSCENNWWATLLYIQNYVCPEAHCVGHAWYLAVDTQLFFLSPLILIPLTKWPRRTLSAVVLLIIGCSAWVFAQTWTHRVGSTYIDETEQSHKFYISTHLRAAPWLIGVIMGYVMHKTQKLPIKINRKLVVSMWIMSLCVLLTIVFGHLSFTRYEYNVARSSFFNSLARPGWSLAISWIIFACTTGYGGLINTFLSLPFFNVLIKLNYNMYLLHVLPINYFAARTRISTYFSVEWEAYSVWSDFVVTLILAFLWTLAFESPVIVIERIIFKKDNQKASN